MKRAAAQQGFFGLDGIALYAVVALAAALVLSWAGTGLAIWHLEGKAEAADRRAAEALAARAAEEQSRRGFEAASTACSAGVDLLKRRADAVEAMGAKVAAQNRELSKSVQAHVQALLSRPRPAGMDVCQAMLKELDDEIDHRAPR